MLSSPNLLGNLLTIRRVEVLRAKYGDIFSPCKQGASITWRSIQSAAHVINAGLDPSYDTPYWKDHPKGTYTVSSGYHSQLKDIIEGKEDQIWDDIWRLKGPSRGNHFLWKLCHNALPAPLPSASVQY
jgi:hypothetical protein